MCIAVRVVGSTIVFAAALSLFGSATSPPLSSSGDGPPLPALPREFAGVPLLDLDGDASRQVVVDREAGQYLGHVSTLLLEDGKTILAAYPKGHGRGAIVLKRSDDGGLTWSARLPTPENWSTSLETPTIHRVVDPTDGTKRLILFSGLYPARSAISENDGQTWMPLRPIGDWGGIVVMGFCEPLRDGSYLAMFHDDGRFFAPNGKPTGVFTLYQTISRDGGRTWDLPRAIWSGRDVHLCEPGFVRSPDGKSIAVLLRENRREKNSHVIISTDEAASWSQPRELALGLTGDRHIARYGRDGSLAVTFRDMASGSPTRGDWLVWIGTFDDIMHGRLGSFRVRLKDNLNGSDCAYAGLECLPDGTFVATTYGHRTRGEQPSILSVRFDLKDLRERLNAAGKADDDVRGH